MTQPIEKIKKQQIRGAQKAQKANSIMQIVNEVVYADRDKAIYRLSTILGLTLREIANIYDLSPERVKQILKREALKQ